MNLKQIFPNLDGIKFDYSTHSVSEETGEVNKIHIEEVDCPETASWTSPSMVM